METPRSPFSPSFGWMGHVVMNDERLHNISLIRLNHTHRLYQAVDDSGDLYTDPTCSKTAVVRRATVRKAHTHFPARIKREGWQEQMEALKRLGMEASGHNAFDTTQTHAAEATHGRQFTDGGLCPFFTCCVQRLASDQRCDPDIL